jgi:hypothetical protein
MHTVTSGHKIGATRIATLPARVYRPIQHHGARLRRADRFLAHRRFPLNHVAPEPQHDAYGSNHADATLTTKACSGDRVDDAIEFGRLLDRSG